MKTLRKISLALLAGFLVMGSGCDWLELLPPDGLVVDEYWKTKEDVESTLIGAYSAFSLMDSKLFYYGELRGDLVRAENPAPGYLEMIMDSDIFSNNSLCDWSSFYAIINYCNNVISLAPGVLEIDQTFTEYQMRSYQSEAIFLRSLAYFYLVRIFGDVPYVSEPTLDDNVDFYLPKSSGDSILEVIKAELKERLLTTPETYTSLEEDRGRATKAAVNALLADISLWQFEYEEVLSHIEKIENSDKYFLMTSPLWFQIYLPGNSLESIFEFQFNGLGQSNKMYDITYNWEHFSASDRAIEILDPEEETSGGERVRGKGSISIANKGYLIFKYCGGAPDRKTFRSSAQARACNFIVYRLADILLMKAEALSQLDRYGEAQQIINQIRTRALVETFPLSHNRITFEDAILEERAKELAFEGKRYFDLMRMGRRNDYERKTDFIEIIIQKAPSTQKLVLSSKLSNPLGWYLPIYEKELEKNANLVQNPYYDTDF